jgi:hypothetical protein
MAELTRTFTSGRMNKDLDERLLPPGEYRDALNLQLATSSSSQVGTFQNIKGNLELRNKAYNRSQQVHTIWTSGYIDSLSNARCVGSIADGTSEIIYWFIASDNVSAIAAYNSVTKVVSPLIVDTNNILKFSTDFLITGVNILEGMLLWTDNQTEPKKININEWVGSTSSFLIHSQIYGRNFIESDITVIKKFPLQPPSITAYTTTQVDANGNPAIVDTITTVSFWEELSPGGDIIPRTGEVTLTWGTTLLPYYNIGDVLLLTSNDNDPLDPDFTVRVVVQETSGGQAGQTGAVVEISSVGGDSSAGTSTNEIHYNVTLEQEAPFFEFKFARFAYRWKFKNNELSCFSPFTNPVFIPGLFDYSPKEGYNLAMTNNIRQLEVSNYITVNMPDDVVAVDLLYKDSNAQNVYIVDTFKPDDDEWVNNTFNIKTEIISSVVQSNQILRPWDNVPRFALGQEITGNRVIYANYTQNFNLLDSGGNPAKVNIEVTFNTDSISTSDGARLPAFPSVKTMRTYQVGVVFMDKYGRTTPVFTSTNASVKLDKEFSGSANSLKAKLTTPVPFYNQSEQFPNYKYFIKETSREYYNLALDRYYDAEDGNIWLSFPSSERNKVDENTFLILKKEHDGNNPVLTPNKYKIIAIENEAPQYLKDTKISLGTMATEFNVPGFPIEGATFVEVSKDTYNSTFGDLIASTSGLVMRVSAEGNSSAWYNISTTSSQNEGMYRLTVSDPFGEDMNFTSTYPYGWFNKIVGLNIELASIESINKPQFTGRFFVKVNQDDLLKQALSKAYAGAVYKRITSAPIFRRNNYQNRRRWNKYVSNDGPNAYSWDSADVLGLRTRWFSDHALFACELGPGGRRYGFNSGSPINANDRQMDLSYSGGGWSGESGGSGNDVGISQYAAFYNNLTRPGSVFRFRDDPTQTLYKINSVRSKTDTFTWNCNQSSNNGSEKQNYLERLSIGYDFVDGSQGRFTWNPDTAADSPLNFTDGGGLNPSTEPGPGNFNRFDKYIWMDFLEPDLSEAFSTNNPAVFETEPKEAAELNIYYEIPTTYGISSQPHLASLDWFNCYSFGNGVESDRIRDDYNAPTIGNGVKASAVLEEPYKEETRYTGLIFSQIFNSTSGVNNLNQFIQAENITKDVLPEYGSIQKLRARDTNLVTLCEDKCLGIFIDKDALYNADGNVNVTSNSNVLGQTTAYSGEFGISKNPESFAEFGNRIYFTDKARGTVLRLSNNGLTEIADKGMHGFYSDNLVLNKNIIGSYDTEGKEYNVSLNTLLPYWQQTLGAGKVIFPVNTRIAYPPPEEICVDPVNEYPTETTTISFSEDVGGWTSRRTYVPEAAISLNNSYYSFKDGLIWEHYENPLYNTFYGVGPSSVTLGQYYESSFTVLFNEAATSVKGFKALNYTGTESIQHKYLVAGYGSRKFSLAEIQAKTLIPYSISSTPGWYTNYIVTDLQEGEINEFIDKEGKKFNYIKGLQTFFNTNCENNVDSQGFNVQGIGKPSAISGGIDPTVYTVTVWANDACWVAI